MDDNDQKEAAAKAFFEKLNFMTMPDYFNWAEEIFEGLHVKERGDKKALIWTDIHTESNKILYLQGICRPWQPVPEYPARGRSRQGQQHVYDAADHPGDLVRQLRLRQGWYRRGADRHLDDPAGSLNSVSRPIRRLCRRRRGLHRPDRRGNQADRVRPRKSRLSSATRPVGTAIANSRKPRPRRPAPKPNPTICSSASSPPAPPACPKGSAIPPSPTRSVISPPRLSPASRPTISTTT